jgi:hypothetical protein
LRERDWVPVGSGSVWYELLRRGARARFQWEVGYRPDINVLAGTLQNRLYTSALAGLVVDRSSLRLTLGAARTLPSNEPDANDVISADLAFEQQLLDWLALELGGQLFWQGIGSATPLAFEGSRWLVYGGLEASLPEVRF